MKLWDFFPICAKKDLKHLDFKHSKHSDIWWFAELIAALQDLRTNSITSCYKV